jgi:hypothetical protein
MTLLLACSLPSVAQQAELPDAPRAVAALAEASTAPLPSTAAVINPVIAPVKPAQEQRRVADKKFWTLTAYDFAMTQIDIQTTMWSLNSRKYVCKETFSAAFVGEHPNRVTLEATGVASNVGFSLLSYWLKKRGSNKWWIPQMTSGTAHLGAAAWNQFGSGCY